MKVTIYHNPRCSKSRQTLALLEANGVKPQIIEYLVSPPDRKTLSRILSLLDLNARDIMRTTEPVYKEKDLGNEALTEDELIDAMIENPILIERPIVITDGKAVIGRPPENVLQIL